jgi:hypothetical protein
MALPLSR